MRNKSDNPRSLMLTELQRGGFVVSHPPEGMGYSSVELYATKELEDAFRFIREAWGNADELDGFSVHDTV